MIDTKAFYCALIRHEFDFFTGVPDSLLKELCCCIDDNAAPSRHITAANEGNAVAIASGYHVATGRYGVVYMQNSGIGNAINPLLSLSDPRVYDIPMLLIIGYRGEPGTKDEPQHITQGELTLPLLDTLGIHYAVLKENYESQLAECLHCVKELHRSAALIVRKDTFSTYQTMSAWHEELPFTRESALETIIRELKQDAYIVSTTGKTSREIYEIRERFGMSHSNDFLTVGSMGHTASLALGISLFTDQKIYCIDGDGSFIMHMGGVAVAAQNAGDHFRYILINNGCHQSVGGQKTIADQINLTKLLSAFGFPEVYSVNNAHALQKHLRNNRKIAIVVNVNCHARDDLGRPTATPIENKILFQDRLNHAYESDSI